ncbi:hypothetical protein BGZ76_010890 [Entomortierella beljakovae]|nr:hypothetical protein BGZ76_010890 [Entomortierella beljakovae]
MQQQQQQHHNGENGVSLPTSPRHGSSTYSVSRIIDISAIELEKENIQPIRQGRSAQVLNRLFTAQHDDRAQELALQHQIFQSELERADEFNDPMDIYMRYVSWTIESYPQGGAQGHDSRLVSILEQAIERFKDEERYKNDPRFVKLFVLYSEKVELPIDVFNFMETNKIGCEISMYYEEYADYLESREEFVKAKEIFLLGIHRRARPLGRLKRLFEEFERRADFYTQEQERKAIEDPEPELPHQPARSSGYNMALNPTRRVLGNKISGQESRHANETTMGHVPVGSSSSSSRISTLPSHQRPNSRLEVFSDQSAQTSSNGRARPRIDNHSTQENNPWRDLGADQIRRKENTREATSWKGTRLTSEDTLPKPQRPKLQIWRDDDNTILSDPPVIGTKSEERVSNPTPSEIKTQSTQEHSEAIAVQEYPQSNPREYSKNSNQSAVNNGWSPRFPITRGEKGGQERLMIDLEQIYVDEDEFSIEEIRSRHIRYTHSMEQIDANRSSIGPNRTVDDSRPSSTSSMEQIEATSSSVVLNRTEVDSRPPTNESDNSEQHDQYIPQTPPKRTFDNNHLNDHISVPVKPVLPMDLSDDDEDGKSLFGTSRHAITPSSPTIHTKYASAEMNKIFSDRSRSRKSWGSQWSNDDNKDVEEHEIDRFTMAYSIPSLEYQTTSHEYLDNEVQDEYDDDDDDQYEDGRTEGFVSKLEKGYPSTITQDIEALKRKHAAENESTRTSFGSNKRNSSKFDPNRRRSDVTTSSNLDR